jgi:hypothetical protein
MVSKQHLQEELNSFNKQLEKHLSGIGVDLLDDTSFNTSSLSSDNSETMLLLTQSLKDIRMEMNLMRKHMASDTEVMLKSLMNAQQRQFQDEMRAFQERTFKILKVFDPSILKEINSEIGRVSTEQSVIKSDISEIKSLVDKKISSQNNIDLKVELEPLFMSLTSQQEKLESQVSTLFSREKNKLENFEMILRDTLDGFNVVLNQKQDILLSSVGSLDTKTKKDLLLISKKVDMIESNQETFFNTLNHDVSSLSTKLGIQKKELLHHTNTSEKVIFQKISDLEENIHDSGESLNSIIDKKLLQFDTTLNNTKDEVLLNVSESENFLFKKSVDLEEGVFSSRDKLDILDSKLNSTFEELSSIKKSTASEILIGRDSLKNQPDLKRTSSKKEKIIQLDEVVETPEVRVIDNKEKLLNIESRLRKLSLLK